MEQEIENAKRFERDLVNALADQKREYAIGRRMAVMVDRDGGVTLRDERREPHS